MIITQFHYIARATLLTMKEVVTTTDSTNPALIAMKLLLADIIIIELANVAIIFSHVDTTVRTKLSNLLLCIANGAYNLLHILPDKFMAIFGVAEGALRTTKRTKFINNKKEKSPNYT